MEKIDVQAILDELPKNVSRVACPEKTRTVYIDIDIVDASKKASISKSVKKVARKHGLSIVHEISDDETCRFVLEDLQFNKDMRKAAKECLKAVKAFYDKYGVAYRYDDDACETVRDIIKKVNNED